MAHRYTVLCNEPFTFKLTLTAVSELEECEEVGGGVSPLQDIKVVISLQISTLPCCSDSRTHHS